MSGRCWALKSRCGIAVLNPSSSSTSLFTILFGFQLITGFCPFGDMRIERGLAVAETRERGKMHCQEYPLHKSIYGCFSKTRIFLRFLEKVS